MELFQIMSKFIWRSFGIIVSFILIPYTALAKPSILFDNRDKNVEKAKETVVITATRANVIQKTDRTIYKINNLPEAHNSTLRDFLSKTPGITINRDNEVIIRGQKALLSASGTSLSEEIALQIVCDYIDSIEVITNPGADTDSKSGPMLKIILKSPGKRRFSGSANFNSSSKKKLSGNISFNSTTGKWHYTNSISFEKNIDNKISIEKQTLYLLNNNLIQDLKSENLLSISNSDSLRLFSSATLDINDEQRIGIQFMHYWRNNNGKVRGLTKWEGSGQNSQDDYRFETNNPYSMQFNMLSLGIGKGNISPQNLQSNNEEKNKKTGRGIIFAIITNNNSISQNISKYYPNRSLRYQKIEFGDKTNQTSLQMQFLDVKEIMQNNVLKTGLSLEHIWNDTFNHQLGYDKALQTQNNLFAVRDNKLSAFATYERPFGKLTVLTGIRYELADMSFLINHNGGRGRKRVDQLIPSLHLLYKISDELTLKSNFSKRTEPFGYSQINPTIIMRDLESGVQGNPTLLPTKINSYEIELNFNKAKYSANFAGFVKEKSNQIEPITRIDSQNIFISTYSNLGSATIEGLEMTLKYKDKRFPIFINYIGEWKHSDFNRLNPVDSSNFFNERIKIGFDLIPNRKEKYSAIISYNGPEKSFETTLSSSAYYKFSYTKTLPSKWTLTLNYSDDLVTASTSYRSIPGAITTGRTLYNTNNLFEFSIAKSF